MWSTAPGIVALLLAVLLGASLVSQAPTLKEVLEPRPKIPQLIRVGNGELRLGAEAFSIRRLKSGEVLAERNADGRVAIASLTKLMTALIFVEHVQPLETVIFSIEAKRNGDADEKRSLVPAGEGIKAEDVVKLLLASSDNDAAYAAAEHVAIRRQPSLADATFADRLSHFVTLMNDRARSLGLAETNFANPAGRDDPGNFSSAGDVLALAAHIAREQPELWSSSRISEAFIFSRSGGRYGLINTNVLLQEYPAIYGSKTGFSDEARGTLFILYQIASADLVAIVLLGSSDRFADGRAAINWVESNFRLEW